MADADSFADLLSRVRAGDEQAAAVLVRRYEPEIRREVRFRLRDLRLRRVLDSLDICQSVLASFFARAALGSYALDGPDHLIRLLVVLVRNKVTDQVRRHRADRRDIRRHAADGARELEAVTAGPTPSRVVSGKELLQQFEQRLSEEERQLVVLRQQGCDWGEVAARLGGSADGRRKQMARAVERVARALGLDGESDG